MNLTFSLKITSKNFSTAKKEISKSIIPKRKTAQKADLIKYADIDDKIFESFSNVCFLVLKI